VNTRVAFDLRWISRDPGGITTHALNLLRALVLSRSEFQYVALLQSGGKELAARYLGGEVPGLEFMTVNYTPFSPLNSVRLPGQLLRAGFSIYHTPNYLGFLLPASIKTLVTVHDLTSYLFPRRRARAKSVQLYPLFAYALRRSLAQADVIAADSENTRADIYRHFPAQGDKVQVVYDAINPVFFERHDTEMLTRVRRQFNLQGPVILYVGRRDPVKNLIPLIEAVGRLHRNGRKACLVVSGPPDPRFPEPEQKVRELGLENWVRFPGFVELDVLRALYQLADVVAYPSSYEGFGLPPLEAMASGTPLVCSNRASLPEVVGDAAVFVEPEDAASIAYGIERVLSDPELKAKLIGSGTRQVRRFSWEASAQGIMTIYRQLLGRSPTAAPPPPTEI
jgi:glycosyltransferase involved in cell wall biosynthesis